MKPFFNLPTNILNEIYEYDSTYRDIFKKQCLLELVQKLSNHCLFNNNKHNLQGKIYTLFKYLCEKEPNIWFKYNYYEEKSHMRSDYIYLGASGATYKYNYYLRHKEDFFVKPLFNGNTADDTDELSIDLYMKYHNFKCKIITNQQYHNNILKYRKYYNYNNEQFTILNYSYNKQLTYATPSTLLA